VLDAGGVGDGSMNDFRRRILLTVVGSVILLLTYASLYRRGMSLFEGEHVSYIRALQVTLEILTTAGFGGDAPWSSPGMNAIVIGMNLTGVLLVFFAIPFFVIPLLENVFQTEAPTETDLSDHLIVCADSPRETALRAELADREIPEVFIKQDAELVRELVRDGVEAIHGNPESERTLESANVADARAIIVDISDEINANVILTARRLNPAIQILSVVEDEDTEAYHEYAGADEVVRPRVAVGKRLASKARGRQFSDSVAGVESDHGSVPIAEILIESGSELIGRTLSECRFRQRFGLTVLGGWFHGEFVAPLEPDRRLVEHSVLLVAGETDELTTLSRRDPPRSLCRRAVIAGYGVVGETVAAELTESGVDVTVVDTEKRGGVDVVGDITDTETLETADVAGADAVVLALSRDSLVVFSALVLEDHAPSVETLARADDVSYVQKCYDAGAEYTLAVSEVTAHMVAARLFDPFVDGTEGDTEQIEVARVRAPGVQGDSLDEIGLLSETTLQIVAVEREGTLRSNPGGSFEVRESDTLILAGDGGDIATFERRYAEAET
jgi:Trk K+ transport system NAD-binding subunit